MWNPNKLEEFEDDDDDESWEVKAFEQDTKGNLSGTTWPPRSYTCNFCRREFRSAQALGGHMNVHRRDRASSRAHHAPTATARSGGGSLVHSCVPPLPRTTLIIQSTANYSIEGLPHFYQLQNPSAIFGNSDGRVNLYGTSSFPSSNLAFSVFDSPVEVSPLPIGDNESIGSVKETTGTSVDELDLELRLGHNPP